MIAFLSNVNIDPIKRFFTGEEIYTAPFGQIPQMLASPDSPLHRDAIDRVLVVLDADELLGDRLHALPTEEVRQAVLADLADLLRLVEQFARQRPLVTVTLTNFAISPHRFTTFLETNSATAFQLLQQQLNDAVCVTARALPNILVVDWNRLVMLHGFSTLVTPSFWYMARVKLNHRALELLARECRLLWRAYSMPPKKVLVLDLDNTLWGGVVGDAGPHGIVLSEDGQGKAYRDFQKAIRSLKELGVLLTINSKNTEATVREAFRTNSMMVLGDDDFACTRINWQDKATNLQEIADELGLGVDSFVFLDDSPVEREIVRGALPQVVVPEFPPDPVDLPGWFLQTVVRKHFGRYGLTASDRAKTTQYHARAKRVRLASTLSVQDTIRALDITLNIERNTAAHVPRVAQMTQKTNQFNMTTQRLTEQQVDAAIRTNDKHVFTVEYQDRFGKEGIVGAMFCTQGPRNLTIENFLMSCRVLGRTVEHAFIVAMLSRFAAADIDKVQAHFVPSERNGVAAPFYPDCGFAETEPGVYESDPEHILATLRSKTLIDEERIHAIA